MTVSTVLVAIMSVQVLRCILSQSILFSVLIYSYGRCSCIVQLLIDAREDDGVLSQMQLEPYLKEEHEFGIEAVRIADSISPILLTDTRMCD